MKTRVTFLQFPDRTVLAANVQLEHLPRKGEFVFMGQTDYVVEHVSWNYGVFATDRVDVDVLLKPR